MLTTRCGSFLPTEPNANVDVGLLIGLNRRVVVTFLEDIEIKATLHVLVIDADKVVSGLRLLFNDYRLLKHLPTLQIGRSRSKYFGVLLLQLETATI